MIVGLVVIGPDRMPEVARSIMYWWGRVRRMVTDTRAELEKEIGADDIRRQLKNEAIMKHLGESKEAIEATLKETTDNIQRFKHIGEQSGRKPMSLPDDEDLIRKKKLAIKAKEEAARAATEAHSPETQSPESPESMEKKPDEPSS